MKNLEMMKQYIREHNLCGRVSSLRARIWIPQTLLSMCTMPTRSARKISLPSTLADSRMEAWNMKNEYIVAIDYSANYKPMTIDYKMLKAENLLDAMSQMWVYNNGFVDLYYCEEVRPA